MICVSARAERTDLRNAAPGGAVLVMDEIVLIQKAKEFDSDAWTEIYHRYYRRIYHYLWRNLGDRDLAEDMAASVFLGATEKIGSFTYRGIPLSAWLYRIAHNMVIDHYRRAKASTLPLSEDLAGEGDETAEEGERLVERKSLLLAIDELTEDQRQVIILKFLEGMSNTEIARIVNKPEGAVKSLQHRALASLRRVMGGERGE